MSTPLQNSMGRMYGGGQSIEIGGTFPVWLDQSGSRIMGGIVDFNAEYKAGLKVSDVYSEGCIRTGTMMSEGEDKAYLPIPTYRVVGAVTTTATKVVIAGWYGLATLKEGMQIQTTASTPKVISITAADAVKNADGNYDVTIAANALGALKDGDALVLKEVAGNIPEGLSKHNLEFKGMDLKSSYLKGNVVICDAGRILSDAIAPVPTEYKRYYLQTIKFEKQ